MHVLLIKTSSLGDVIHTFPALTDAARAIPNIRFDWVIEENFSDVALCHPSIENIIPVSIRRWRKQPFKLLKSKEWPAFKKKLQETHYDLIIDAQGLLKSAWLTRYVDAPIAGFDRSSAREWLASFFYDQKYNIPFGTHAVERTRQLFAQALNYKVPPEIGSYGLDKAIFSEPAKESYILFLHGTTWLSKHWPESYWRELAERITQLGFNLYLPWGSIEEKERAERISFGLEKTTVLSKLSLIEVAQVIANATACISVDTGLGHLAAALDVPSISLYGPTLPALVGAYGKNQKHLCIKGPSAGTGDRNKLCFDPLTPDIVFDTFSEVIAKINASKMQLAFILYKYFPFGGLQRDFLRIALECQRRGHKIRVYTLSWEGEIPEGFELVIVPVKAWFNHRRNERMTAWMKTDLVKRPVDKVIGFNKMPGLDIYYAADGCYEEKAQNLRNRIYTRSERYKHFSGYEKAVFSAESNTQILMISEMQQPLFVKYYQTQISRFHSLPPGVAFDRKAPSNADEIRLHFRSQLKLSQDEYLLLQIGSGFKTKGLDRTLNAIAALPESIKCKVKLIVLGQDDPRLFLQQIQRLNITEQVDILKGRDDVPNFLLSADLLIHPAYHENTGTVLLEALVAGLPVIVSAVCGYAKYIEQAQSGVVLDDPFSQDQLNKILSDTLLNEEQRMQWKDNALIFAEGADLYSMPQKAADVILADYL